MRCCCCSVPLFLGPRGLPVFCSLCTSGLRTISVGADPLHTAIPSLLPQSFVGQLENCNRRACGRLFLLCKSACSAYALYVVQCQHAGSPALFLALLASMTQRVAVCVVVRCGMLWCVHALILDCVCTPATCSGAVCNAPQVKCMRGAACCSPGWRLMVFQTFVDGFKQGTGSSSGLETT